MAYVCIGHLPMAIGNAKSKSTNASCKIRDISPETEHRHCDLCPTHVEIARFHVTPCVPGKCITDTDFAELLRLATADDVHPMTACDKIATILERYYEPKKGGESNVRSTEQSPSDGGTEEASGSEQVVHDLRHLDSKGTSSIVGA